MVFLESIILQTSGSLILDIVIVIGGIVGILVGMKKFNILDKKHEEKKSSPIQRLKERYANGEISDDEFDKMKKKLSE